MTPEESYYNILLTNSGRITTFCTVVPVIIGLSYRKHFNKILWIFWFFILATLIVNLIEVAFIWSVKNYTDFWLPYLKKWEISDTHFLNISSPLKDFSLLGLAYSFLFYGKVRNYILGISAILLVFSIIDYIWITGYKAPGIIVPTLNGFYVIALPMFYLWFLYRNDSKLSIYKNPYFWFSIAQILGHLIGLLFYYTGEKIYETDFVLFVKLSIARNCVTIIRYFTFGYGFCFARYARFFEKIYPNTP